MQYIKKELANHYSDGEITSFTTIIFNHLEKLSLLGLHLKHHEDINLDNLDRKLRKYDVDGFNDKKWSFHLQPLLDIHFNRQISGTGDKGTLFIFISVGVFILCIACFNYMNLYIAHYRSSIKNISIRKVIGASRFQLIQQFLSESFAMVIVSYLVSLIIVWLFLPLFCLKFFFKGTFE